LPERCFHFAWTLFPFCLNAVSFSSFVGTLFSGCLVFAGTLFGYSVASQWGPDAVWILPRRYLVICLLVDRTLFEFCLDAIW
jgi:hypothetical protein